MLISKFDLYKPEWLELVFANRNQQYGAYEMRAHYSNVMARAMMITFFSVALAAGVITYISHHKSAETDERVVNVVVPSEPVVVPPKIKETVKEVKPSVAQPQSTPSVPVQRYVPMTVVPDHLVTEEIKPLESGVAVGSENVKGTGTGDNILVAQPTEGPGGQGVTEDNTTHEAVDLQVMPTPVGGEGAWAKFLQKNLRFPYAAQEQGVSGKVYMSFIIEKDGHLSDITVLRKAGYGFDEESLRVLKLAPAWNPGVQNGQKVRVRYTIPINFQINE